MTREMITPEGDMMLNPATASEWDPVTDATRTDSLRALLDPSIAPLFWRSERAGTFSAWWRHVPFGQWLVLQTNPRVLVELGTHAGVSYSAFCEAVLQGSLATRCHAVDTWCGDEHSGTYGPEVYEEFRRYHDARFASFSTLLRCSFDEALGTLADKSVDLLHIDGLHTYEAVAHDFQSWLPKLSHSAVVLFHDTNERRDDFGVWRLWEELARKYPSFEFLHGHGLGVLAVGDRPPKPVAGLCALSDPVAIASLRRRFAAAGERLAVETELRLHEHDARQQIDAAAATAAQARAELDQARAEFDQDRAGALAQLEQARAEAQRAMAARQVAEIRTQRAEAEIETAARSALLADQRAERAEAAAAAAAAQAAAVTGSTVWRGSRPLRRVLERSPTVRRTARRLLRAAWRTVTFRRRLRERRILARQLRAITTSPLFDREWYLAQYPDVAAAGLDPALHYLTRGGAERRLPGPSFDTGWYLDTYPDVAATGANPLLHYVEYGRAEGRQARYVDPYSQWVQEYDTLSDADRTAIRTHIETLAWHPRFSVLVPVYNTNEDHLREMIESVRQQIYPHWELCIADDGSTEPRVKRVLEDCRRDDPRIKVLYRPSNGHISAASNSALGMATGDFVALLDHDDVLAPHALYMVAHAANAHREADVFYSDEDKLNAEGSRTDPYFKPDWNQELFYGQNFVNHLGVYRTASVRAAGGFRLGFEGSQDYDLALRLVAATRGPVVHIPYVLYHWRIFPGAATHSSTEVVSATAAARRAIKEHLESLGERARVTGAAAGNYHRVVREEPDEWPKVSVIVPTRDHAEMLAECITGLLERTDYPDLEIMIADNESIEAKTEAFFTQVTERGVRVVPSPGPFNFSRINNAAAREATGDILLFLNNDVTVIDRAWLKEMIVHAARPGIGAVGARLLYPDGTIQHAGVVLGIGGVAGHIHCHAAADDAGYFGRLVLTQDISCVTAACMAVPKAVFAQVGGFDEENLAVAFNDVDLCIRIREAGYRIIWTPYAELYHAESKSRGSDLCPSKTGRFHREGGYVQRRWGRLLLEDPFFSPNLSLETVGIQPAFPPRVKRPWLSMVSDSTSAHSAGAMPNLQADCRGGIGART